MRAETSQGAVIIDGKEIARRVRDRVAEEVKVLKARGVTPGLTVVHVGDDPASAVYVASKGKACAEAGMKGDTIRMPSSTTQAELVEVVQRLNRDPSVHGILVQMPLPAGMIRMPIGPGKVISATVFSPLKTWPR